MKINIMTLFPDICNAYLNESIIGRAKSAGIIDVSATNIRDFAFGKHKKCDDEPYSEANGMLMLCEPLYQCHKELSQGKKVHTIMLSPCGEVFSQEKAKDLLKHEHIIMVCGHYEGIDQRFIDKYVDEEISIGDYVLTGGELGALVVADAVCRQVSGVLPSEDCFTDESHFNGRLEYPQYTRPRVWQDLDVPEILLSGHHKNITDWKREQSLIRTHSRRPDLFSKRSLTDEEKQILLKNDIKTY